MEINIYLFSEIECVLPRRWINAGGRRADMFQCGCSVSGQHSSKHPSHSNLLGLFFYSSFT